MRPLLAVLFALGLLTAASAEAAKRPAARPAAAGGALLDTALARHVRTSRYQLQVQLSQHVVGAAIDQRVDVPMLLAADRTAGRARSEMVNPYLSTVMVADGDTLWGHAPTLGQYTQKPVQSLARLTPPIGQPNGAPLHPLLDLAPLTDGVLSARVSGRDTLRLTDRVLDCDRVDVRYAPDTSASGISHSRRTHWIDRASGLVVRDSAEITVEHPQRGTMSSVLERRVVALALAPAFSDTIFAFRPPPGSVRVRRLGIGSDGPSLAGKPAFDFALTGLEGEAVSLADLKGEVVILDFWATWCGPCRRWMPIVQRAHDTLQGKGVRVFAVNLREDAMKVRKYLDQTGVRVPVLMDRDGAVSDRYGARSIPLTVVIGRDGLIVDTLLGVHTADDLQESLRLAGIEYD